MSVEAINVVEVKELSKKENSVKVEPKTEPYPDDTVEISTKKKKKSLVLFIQTHQPKLFNII